MPKFVMGILILFLSVSLPAASGDEKLLQVRDIWSGRSLPGALAVFNGDTLTADKTGILSIPALIYSGREFRVEKQEYFPREIKNLKKSDNIIYLVPIESADAITVTASEAPVNRLAVPAHISHIDIKADERNKGRSLEQLLQNQSGIHVKTYGASGQLQTVSLRGMTAGQTQLQIDGIPMNSLQLGDANIAHFDAAQLSSLEIYRGGSAHFGGGGAAGGVVNLHPVQPKDKAGYQAAYKTASFNNEYIQSSLDLPVQNLKQRFSFSKASGKNDYAVRENDDKILLKNRDFKNRHLTHTAVLSLSSRFSIDSYLSSYVYNGGSSQPFLGSPAETANTARMELDNNLARLRVKYSKPGHGAYLQGYVRNEWMTYTDTSVVVNNQPARNVYFNQETGIQLKGRCLISDKWLVSGGFEAVGQKVDGSFVGKRHRERYAGYLLTDYQIISGRRFLDELHLNGSLRIEDFIKDELIFLPAAGISAQWREFRAYVSAGRNYRAPTFNDLYWLPNGNPNLKAENAVNGEAGLGWNSLLLNINWDIAASVFSNQVTDQIQWMPDGNLWQPRNIAAVKSRGAELDVRIGHINKLHQLSFNYTFINTVKDKAAAFADRTAGNQLPFLPREKWSLAVQSGRQGFRAGIEILHSSFSYLTIENRADDILPSYTIAGFWSSLGAEFFGQKLVLTFNADNIFDKNYEVYPGYPMPPRNYRLGIEISY